MMNAANIPGKTLYIKGIKVQSAVTTVLAGGPVLYEYTLAYGHTAVSMATTDTSTTKSPRRVGVGFGTYVLNAAVGTLGSPSGQYLPFGAPIAVNPGEFVAVTAKNLGLVTTTGVVLFLVTFDCYFE